MADISFDVAEGYYLSPFITNMILSGNVQSLQFSINGAPPSISKYVAYDQLDPPNPFIAVTQDGNGNVVYDGGFPKFCNRYAPTEGIKDSVSVEFNGTCSGVASEAANGNCYYYNQFAADIVTIATGDKLVYDVLINDARVRTGIDATTNAQPNTATYSLRDWGIDYANLSKPYGLVDHNGRNIHPAADLSDVALNKWYHREISLTKCAGHTFRKWTMGHESDVAGVFSARYRDIYIVDRYGRIKTTLFKDVLKLPGNTNTEFGASGYTNLSKAVYDPRAQLTASFKYLYNAILWVANEQKFLTGNRKILILGDAAVTGSYPVKGTDASGFYTSFSRLCATVGFTPTFKDVSDYSGGSLNPTLTELDAYTCVLVMGSASATSASITDAGVQAMMAFRDKGNGVIMITDHGPVLNDISQAYPAIGTAFFHTVNKIAVNFGTYFSGNYDRTPVNVGFLRTTYGDHPLYGGMADTESINAGGSESRVQVQVYETITPAQLKPFNIGLGKTIIQVAAMLKSGDAVSFKITYNVGPFKIGISDGKVTRTDGQTLDVRVKNQSLINVVFNEGVEVPVAGVVSKNGVRVGEFTYTAAGGVVQIWDGAGSGPVMVDDGDRFKLAITTPMVQNCTVAIKRFQPAIRGMRHLAAIMKLLRVYDTTKNDITVIRQLITEIGELVPWLGLKQSDNIPINLKLLGDFFNNEGLASIVLPNAATKPYVAGSRNWTATGAYSLWKPTNPVTGTPIDFGHFAFSPVYGSESVPANFKLDYYANVYLPAGNYRIFSQADDIFQFFVDGVQMANKSGQGQTDVTIKESRYYALKVSNTNTPNNTPSYWTCAMVDLASGAIVLRPEPGVWKTQEYAAS